MKSNDRESLTNTKPRLSLVSSLSLLTAVAASGGVTLHLMGNATHTTYLGNWGLDAGLFPKATDWMLITGYSTAFDRGVAILKLMSANVLWSLVIFLVLSIYFALLQSPLGSGTGKQPAWLERQSERVRRFLRSALSALLFVCALFFLFGALLALAAVPAVLGATAGKAAVERDMKDYAKGCDKATSSCVQLKKGNEIVGMGFILDSSPTHIAIFDVTQQRARSIPREGVETVAMRAPKF